MKRREESLFTGLEPLEQRRLLSADFAGFQYELRNVPGSGFHEDYSVQLRLIEGSIGDDGSLFSTLFGSSAEGPVPLKKGLPFGKLYRALDGRLERPGDDDGCDDVVGAGLINGEGSPLGFTSKHGGGQLVRPGTVEFLMERATDTTADDFLGDWYYVVLGVSDEPGQLMLTSPEFTASGSFTISFVEVDDDGDEMTPPVLVGQIDWGTDAAPELGRMTSTLLDGTGEDGLLETEEGTRYYIAPDGDTMVFADLNGSDGSIFVGIAVRPTELGEGEEIPAEDVTGQYIVQNISTAKSNPNSGDVASAYGFVLKDDGTVLVQINGEGDDSIDYTPEELAGMLARGDSIDMGGGKYTEGTWELDGDCLKITVGTTVTEYLVAKADGLLVLKDPDTGRAFGLAVRTLPLEDWENAVADDDGVGAYDDEDGWRFTDPAEETGSPAVVGGYQVWIVKGESDGHSKCDAENRALFAAGIGEGGELLVFKQVANGQWSYENILDGLDGAEPIERDLRVLRTSDGRVLLIGLNADGEVVYFETTDDELLGDDPVWTFTNVSDEFLSPEGEDTPEFAGSVFAFSTAWNTLAFAGLDAEGDLWVVWTTPDIDTWYANNLTEQFNHEGYAGDMDVSFTAWGGINITGSSLNGAVMVTWWVPSFGGYWAQDDLGAVTGGPKLVGGSAFDVKGEQFGLVGLTDEGDLVIFSWSADEQEWKVLAVADAEDLSDEIVRQEHGVRAIVTEDGLIRILATTSKGLILQFRPFDSIDDGWAVDELD